MTPSSNDQQPNPPSSEAAAAAFDRYVLPELEVLYRTARSLSRSHVDAEDLVQDTLVRAFRAIERFDSRIRQRGC